MIVESKSQVNIQCLILGFL